MDSLYLADISSLLDLSFDTLVNLDLLFDFIFYFFPSTFYPFFYLVRPNSSAREGNTACLIEAVVEAVEVVPEELHFAVAEVLVGEDPMKEGTVVEAAENIVEGPNVMTEGVIILFPIVNPHAGATGEVEEDEVQQMSEVAVAVAVAEDPQGSTSKLGFPDLT